MPHALQGLPPKPEGPAAEEVKAASSPSEAVGSKEDAAGQGDDGKASSLPMKVPGP